MHAHFAPDMPGRLPVVGHLLTLHRQQHRIWDWCTEVHAQLGRTVRFVVGPAFCPAIVMIRTTEPQNVEHILKTNFNNYGKGEFWAQVFAEFMGRGIFSADGEHWLQQRKIAAKIFSKRMFSQNMTRVFQEHARRLVSELGSRIGDSGGCYVEMQELFFAFTMDSFCEIAFGLTWNSIEVILEESSTSDVDTRRFSKSFDDVQEACISRFAMRPFWKVERALHRLGLFPKGSTEDTLAEAAAHINAVVGRIIDERLAEQGSERDRESDLLSLFLGVTQDRTYLRDVVINFLLAGRDTTACTLTWLFWEIARAKPVEGVYARIRSEVLGESPDKATDDFSFESLSRLKYCSACIRETIRLHPPVPDDSKEAFADDVLPDGTLVLKGELVAYEPYAMARDSGLWGEDAASWVPERWLEMENEPSSFLFTAFQAGPRICLGKDMALLEVRAVLAQLVRMGMRWEVDAEYMPTYRYPSAVQPMALPGLPLRVYFVLGSDA